MTPSKRPLRIVYAAGPGDVVGTYRHWKEQTDDPSQVAITYSGQFFDLCRDLGAQAYVISHCARRDKVVDVGMKVENRPIHFERGPGSLYHFGQLWAGLRLVASAIRFRADVILTMGEGAWYVLALPPLFGIKVVVTLHGLLWRVTHPPRGIDGFIWRLSGRFFRNRAAAFMSISEVCMDQVRAIVAAPLRQPVLRFVPTYRRESFAGVAETRPPSARPFRVFYAGRIEVNKGVFDLLQVAKRFAAEGRTDVEFDLCGEGDALGELRQAADEAGIVARFRCHGHVNKPFMRRMYEAAHLVVVPTTTDSFEGLNKVVVESVLAWRPVVTSRMCPALEYVRGAVVEVPVNDTKAYGDAILRLLDDRAFYDEKVQGCAAATEQFYDPAAGWGATFRRVLGLIGLLPTEDQEAGSATDARASARATPNAR